jgi:error-prone DNA polymerase
LLAARRQHPFTSIQDLALRVPELRKTDLALLAKIGALNSLGGFDERRVANGPVAHRRDALWQVEYAARPAGPLLNEILSDEISSGEIGFDERMPDELAAQTAESSPLQPMTIEERLVADFSGTGVTVGKHPMAFHRARLKQMGISAAGELARLPHGRTTRIAGCVIARQRPGTAKGFVFLSLEDETGIANAILTPAVYEQCKHAVVYERFLLIEGELQNQENVISLKARAIRPLKISQADVRSHDFH